MKVSDMFPNKYLAGADLGGKAFTLTMSDVTQETMQSAQGSKSYYILHFDGAEKGLILNRTNANQIAELYGDDTSAWPGKRITIYPVQITVAGQPHTAIRVRKVEK